MVVDKSTTCKWCSYNWFYASGITSFVFDLDVNTVAAKPI